MILKNYNMYIILINNPYVIIPTFLKTQIIIFTAWLIKKWQKKNVSQPQQEVGDGILFSVYVDHFRSCHMNRMKYRL